MHRDLLFLCLLPRNLKVGKKSADVEIDLGDNDDAASQFDICLGAESPLSANLTKLPNLSLPQLQSVNLARFDLNIRCAPATAT